MLIQLLAVVLGLSITRAQSIQALLEPEPLRNVQSVPLCKNIPGDAGWPQQQTWSRLNRTVNGGLISTVPMGSVCHDPTYNESKCKELLQNWGLAQLDVPQPAEFMSLYFQNNSCTPFSPRSMKCELGNYASYSINVRSIDDVRAGLTFVQKYNVRLVIKNSGHDFYGHSTGKGSLALWMHNYNEVKLIKNYSSPYYNGPAMKVQTGAEGEAAASFAAEHGYTVVSGACPTVKMAGGYLAGGGHSYLAGIYGFGADNVLEWEIVKADGSRVVATPNQNTELYWALSGGGGGTYGVVLSAIVRIFPSEVTANAAFAFTANQAGGVDQFWDSIGAFHHELKPLIDQGVVAEYGLSNDSLIVTGIMAPGHTSSSLKSLLRPLLQAISRTSKSKLTEKSLRIKYSQARGYYDLYRAQIQSHLEGLVFPATIAGRFIPREVMDQKPQNVGRALREIANRGYSFAAITLNAINSVRNQTAPPIAPNAVQPNFVAAYSSLMINPDWSNSMPWSEAEVLQKELVSEILPLFDAAIPNAGAYKNEANWAEKDIKGTFYGGTYDKLEAVKREVDPSSLFYGITSVGFDQFEWDNKGRLCRK
ncbi:hypothetical protein NLG97_g518 [Lecanicillium saksenae]|uniref:Uncharacterized protein n=1 Tax=Lecanicillium saksenae TaxID=468837 RepID=A0ACC1R7T0_9HYPO|nr:hypothetical protein NLG97_g518 [Lecanicillium saksenae]